MKSKFHYILFLALSTLTLSCEKDNFDAPKASLTGQLVYNGEAIGLEYNKVNYELYQPGFGKTGPIGSTFTPEHRMQSPVISLLVFPPTVQSDISLPYGIVFLYCATTAIPLGISFPSFNRALQRTSFAPLRYYSVV